MTTEQETAFDIVEGVTDARTTLLATLLSGLPKEEQINQVTEAFFKTWTRGDTGLLDVLERLFGENKIAFRAHLRSLYARCAEAYFPKGYYRPEVQRHIIEKILKGWGWRWLQPTGYFKDKTPMLQRHPDAKECFQFFVEAFLQARNREVEDAFLKCLREHIELYSTTGWNPEDLDEWILGSTLPQEILKVLINGRIRLGGAHMVRAELGFLQPFDLHRRSRGATSLIQQLMEQTRRTDELARMIVNDIRPVDDATGLRNPETPLAYQDKVHWALEAPATARVIITFANGSNPAAIEAVRGVRGAMLLGMGDRTINIVISVRNPEDNSLKDV